MRMNLRISHLLAKLSQQMGGSPGPATAPAASNPLQGLFGNLLLQSPKGFQLLCQVVNERAKELVQQIVHKADERATRPEGKTTVQLVDDLSNEICSAADLTDCVRCMHADPEYARAADESMRFFTCLVETLNTTPELYGALKRSLETERHKMDTISERTAKLLLEDFEHAGVQLQDLERHKFIELSDEIFDAGSRFVADCDRPVELSKEERHRLGVSGKTLNGPWTENPDREIRRLTFSKFYGHNEEQESSFRRLISARHQMAQITGFPSFAHRAQSNSVLCNYENVHSFLANTIEHLSPKVDAELAEMGQLVRSHSSNVGSGPAVAEWDIGFATLLRRQHLLQSAGLDQPAIARHFHLDTLLDGLEWLIGALYGLRFSIELPEPGECWPGNVIKLNVLNREDNSFLGVVFIDADARPTKMQGDCHFTVRCSKLLENGDYQTPIVVLSLSLVSPQEQQLFSGQSPLTVFEQATVSPHQAENFFHEMGHAMHSILGRTRFQHVAGTRCPTDFAEVPSHIMECFFSDARILQKICRDKSGRELAADQLEAIIQSRNIFSAVHTMNQAVYSQFDLEVHGLRADEIHKGELSSTQLFQQIRARAMPRLECAPDYAYQQRISHLVTYGAKYYSYLVARASASLIYDKLFAEDPLSRENGLKWAQVQSHGGEYPSDVLLAKALALEGQRAPGPDQLTDALMRT